MKNTFVNFYIHFNTGNACNDIDNLIKTCIYQIFEEHISGILCKYMYVYFFTICMGIDLITIPFHTMCMDGCKLKRFLDNVLAFLYDFFSSTFDIT